MLNFVNFKACDTDFFIELDKIIVIKSVIGKNGTRIICSDKVNITVPLSIETVVSEIEKAYCSTIDRNMV